MISVTVTAMTKLRTIFFLLFISCSIQAQDLSFLPDRPQGMVNDYASILDRSERQSLENKLRSYRDTTTNAIVVVTLESLRGNSIEETATELFNKWKMWEGDRYNGILLLISESDRSIRLEVGYGLEGAVPDVLSNRIINEVLQPAFRAGDFYSGIDRATDILIQLSSGEFQGNPESFGRQDGGGFPVDILIILIVIILFIVTKGGRGGGRRGRTIGPVDVLLWSTLFSGGNRSHGGFGGGSFGGGGGFGGFGGGGGFGSGGGGASGGW